jgi:hypothetical protein
MLAQQQQHDQLMQMLLNRDTAVDTSATIRSSNTESRNLSDRATRLQKFATSVKHLLFNCSDSDLELPNFLCFAESILERVAVPNDIRATIVLPYLSVKARNIAQKFSDEIMSNWNLFQQSLLSQFKLSSMRYKHIFSTMKKLPNETWLQFSSRCQTMLDIYIKSRQVEDYSS